MPRSRPWRIRTFICTMKEPQDLRQPTETRGAWEDVWRGHWYSDASRRLRRSRHKLNAIYSRCEIADVTGIVCEVGCGAGYFVTGLVEKNPEIRQAIGCDHSLTAIQRAISHSGRNPRLHFVVSDTVSLPFPTSTLDAVYAICLLEHIPDVRAAIEELSRVLRPNANIFCLLL
jgi:ubiquinone/menaquinone biosynthesis C-methylase UbiE